VVWDFRKAEAALAQLENREVEPPAPEGEDKDKEADEEEEVITGEVVSIYSYASKFTPMFVLLITDLRSRAQCIVVSTRKLEVPSISDGTAQSFYFSPM